MHPLFKHEIEKFVKDGLKPGLSGFKSCVFLIEMAIGSGMELHRVRLESEDPGVGETRCRSKGEERMKEVSRLVSRQRRLGRESVLDGGIK